MTLNAAVRFGSVGSLRPSSADVPRPCRAIYGVWRASRITWESFRAAVARLRKIRAASAGKIMQIEYATAHAGIHLQQRGESATISSTDVEHTRVASEVFGSDSQ